MKKYVVARTKGPKYQDHHPDTLTIDKRYEIIEICGIQKRYKGIIDGSYNPKEASFFIKVIDDSGRPSDIWNFNFYSTEELRNITLKEILNENT